METAENRMKKHTHLCKPVWSGLAGVKGLGGVVCCRPSDSKPLYPGQAGFMHYCIRLYLKLHAILQLPRLFQGVEHHLLHELLLAVCRLIQLHPLQVGQGPVRHG